MPKELREGEIEITVYLNSGANIHSENRKKMRVYKDDWDEMDEQERADAVLEHFFQHCNADYGYDA